MLPTILVIAICASLALLVVYAPVLAVGVFLIATALIFGFSVKDRGFWRAAWEAIKRLVTGW